MRARDVDVIVVGGGPAGEVAAGRLGQAGLEVEVAEWLQAATIAIAGAVPIDELWHAVPSFPTRSEVWLRLLEAYEAVPVDTGLEMTAAHAA